MFAPGNHILADHVTTIIEHKGIATIIGSTRLSVPVHQRSYEWTKEEVSELLSDLEGAFARGRDEYFLGSIVVVAANDTDRHSVLDGQQRLHRGSVRVSRREGCGGGSPSASR